ncbi:hypothetical protein N7457_007165 [Penicillium paradoxum]|uniref:uncharacterized protein n=1 Tax=Penicillium paradoxum TaxID=176176 RepID=UPI0025470F92|nr:uncharacterized protein N7457_007165 [Penicillium paradoxum]KAJ5779445.1 hypothetical protein N7457_007165 [Penicillium paradoxum]
MPDNLPLMPRTPRQKHLTRDERLKILVLLDEGQSYSEIAPKIPCSIGQVRYTRLMAHPTPTKRTGRKPILTEALVLETIDWIRKSFDNRCKKYDEIVMELQLPCCGETLRRALKKYGMTARPAALKPPLDPDDPKGIERRRKRLEWALERQHWDYDEWRTIIFTNEAYVRSR